MVRITVYTRERCPHCEAAKALLRARGLDFEEWDLTDDRKGQAELFTRSGLLTLPQVFIGGELVGGADQLRALDRRVGLAAVAAS